MAAYNYYYYYIHLMDFFHDNLGKLAPERTRRPASADRTARAANFKQDLEAT